MKDWEKVCIRPVVNPENYAKFEKICEQIAGMYINANKESVERTLVTNPTDSRFVTIYTMIKVAEAKCPAYWIQADLLTALMNSQMDLEPETLKWAMKTGIIMLPHGLMRSPGRGFLEAILWHKTEKELFWAALSKEDVFCRRFTLNGNRKQFTDTEIYSGEAIADFNDYLQPIFLRIMVLMEARPELVETPTETIVVNKGFAKNKAKTLYQPIWIGREYRIKTQGNPSGGTHASPRVHWRRGFLRSQPCGEGRKQRKLIWIEPTLVMSVAETPVEQTLVEISEN